MLSNRIIQSIQSSPDPAVCLVAAGPGAGVPAVTVATDPVPGTVPVLVTLAPVEMVHLEMVPPHQVSLDHCHHHHHHDDQEHGHGVNTTWLMMSHGMQMLIIKQGIENEFSLAQTTTAKLIK